MIGEDRIMRISDCRMRNVCLKVRGMGTNNEIRNENTGARIQKLEDRQQMTENRRKH